ncbi:phage baseplate protein [Brasilonema sp. UFV-L1]|uniref:T4 family baseplate hub assembly chaperone n=1 Tax=Brasilonema sp. UFV-L1 TaxID=2234130 RepID=UPI00145F0D74|nr:phage baseplate protein [Brasilonema sp. UFV-L1]NMG11110.1 phage baseplate protein [Brasilonema sp. UFV-L1]
MRTLSPQELLQVWEQGLNQPPVQRALLLLAAACPETSTQLLGKLSVGQRDTYLLTLREWLFGSQIVSLATCPQCGERLELTFNIADVRVSTDAETVEVLSLNVADYQVQFRLPNSWDLMAMQTASCYPENQDIEAMRIFLLERCLLKVESQSLEVSTSDLSPDLQNAVVAKMVEADPQANVQLVLCCPACNHQWQATFDIVSFLWSEINAWAYRTLREVHTLASTYGWREADILAMNPQRRQFYLEMVGV